METKVRGIVVRAADYKDSDKIIRLYTLEQGKLGVLMRGVKKRGAKLKIAAQPFCFGEYLLSGNKDFPLTTGCTVEESFFSLAADPDIFMAAAAVMEILDKCVPEHESNPALFVQTLRTMKALLKANQITNYNVQITNQMGNGKGQMGNAGAAARAVKCHGDGVSDTRYQLLRPRDTEQVKGKNLLFPAALNSVPVT